MEKTLIKSIEDWVLWLASQGADAMFWPQPIAFPCVAVFKMLRQTWTPTTTDLIVEYVYQHDIL